MSRTKIHSTMEPTTQIATPRDCDRPKLNQAASTMAVRDSDRDSVRRSGSHMMTGSVRLNAKIPSIAAHFNRSSRKRPATTNASTDQQITDTATVPATRQASLAGSTFWSRGAVQGRYPAQNPQLVRDWSATSP